MRRPQRVGDAIEQLDSGLHIGRYGGITLYSAYQPIFSYSRIHGLNVVGMEGLVRPFVDDVSITPSLLFQQTKAEDALFMECMCQALHIRNYNSAAPADSNLFLNINPASYTCELTMEREFNYMLGQLQRNGLDQNSVVFELLETVPCCDDILKWLRDFARANGVKFAIDDFGQGQSNLKRYELLKPDLVKIDGHVFARGMKPSHENQMMQSIISRVHDDGGKIVIEGIETPTMLAAALELKADMLQGFYLDTPHIPPHDFFRHHFPAQSNAVH